MLLSDYEYVHQCLKFGTDVHVTVVMLTDANRTFSYEVMKYIVCMYVTCFMYIVHYYQRRRLLQLFQEPLHFYF